MNKRLDNVSSEYKGPIRKTSEALKVLLIPINSNEILYRAVSSFVLAVLLLLLDWHSLFGKQLINVTAIKIYNDFTEVRHFLGIILIIFGFFYLHLFLGLLSKKEISKNSLSEEIDFSEKSSSIIDEQIKDFERNLVIKSNELLKTENIEARISEAIDNRISKQALTEIAQKLKADLVELNSSENLKKSMDGRFTKASGRAIEYCGSARSQASWFRSFGFIFAFIGICFLAYSINQSTHSFAEFIQIDDKKILSAFFYKNALVYLFIILSEFLALIMFRYSSKSLEYMRYFSNEATNIDTRHSAFLLAFHLNDKKALAELIKSLDKTERNFLIDKNQRTLETTNNENEDKAFEKFTKFFKLINKEEASKKAN